jgi:hypothetical protein
MMSIRTAWRQLSSWIWDVDMKYPRPFLGWRQMMDTYRQMNAKPTPPPKP